VRLPSSSVLLLMLLAPALVGAGLLADRALRREEEASRGRAALRRDESSAQAAQGVLAAMARLDAQAAAREPAGDFSFRMPAPPAARVSAARREGMRSLARDVLAARLSAVSTTPSALPESVVAAIALGDDISRETAAEKLLTGRLPVRPDDVAVLADALGHADDARIAPLVARLREIPDAASLPRMPRFSRSLARGRVRSWSRDGGDVVHWSATLDTLARESALPEGAALLVRGGGAPIEGVAALGVEAPLDLRDVRRSRLQRAGLLALLMATGVAGLLASRALARESRTLARERAFLATITHEMRTPVTAARLLGETLADGRGDPREYGVLIAREAARLETLVERSLLAARTEAALAPAPCRPGDVLIHCAALARPLAERVGKSLRWEGAVEGVATWDAEAVREALSNLVDNALRHGGAHVVVRASAEGASVRFDVEDDGRGLDRSERSRVFGRFVRGSSEAAGTGLGLWLVDRVARAHGGSVDVRSERGRGCTFTLRLPLRPPAAQADGSASSEAPA